MENPKIIYKSLLTYAPSVLEDLDLDQDLTWQDAEVALLHVAASSVETKRYITEAGKTKEGSMARILGNATYIVAWAKSLKVPVDVSTLDQSILSSEDTYLIHNYVQSLGLPKPRSSPSQSDEKVILTEFDQVVMKAFSLKPEQVESFKEGCVNEQDLLRSLAIHLASKPLNDLSESQRRFCSELTRIARLPSDQIRRFPSWDDVVNSVSVEAKNEQVPDITSASDVELELGNTYTFQTRKETFTDTVTKFVGKKVVKTKSGRLVSVAQILSASKVGALQEKPRETEEKPRTEPQVEKGSLHELSEPSSKPLTNKVAPNKEALESIENMIREVNELETKAAETRKKLALGLLSLINEIKRSL